MDRETLSNYGWIVICTLILAVMLALATPFGEFIAGAFKATYAGFGNVTDNALAVIGIGNGGNGGSGNEGQTPTNGKLNAPNTVYDDAVDYSDWQNCDYYLYIGNYDANTEGFRIYIYDELVATINVGETYTFPGKYGSDAIPYKVVAFADGYEDADPVTRVCMYTIAGIGCEMYHYEPNVSLNGTTLTIASTNEGAGGIMADRFDIYVDGVKVLANRDAQPEGTDFDLSAYLTGDAHEIVVETSYCEAGCKPKAYYTGDWPSVTVRYGANGEMLNAPIIKAADGAVSISFDSNAKYAYLTVNGMDFGQMMLGEDIDYEYDIPVEIWLNDAGILQVGENTISAYVTNEAGDVVSEIKNYTFEVAGNELPAPMVSINGSVLTVSPVLGAESYEVVTIDMYGEYCEEGIILTNDNLSVDLANYFNQNYANTFEIGVIAKADGYADTLSQNTVIYTIEVIRYVTTNFNFKDKEGRILDPDLKILIKYNGNVVCEFTTLGTEDLYNLTVPAEYECDIELYNGSTLLDSLSAYMYVGELEGTGDIVDNDRYMAYSFNNFENTIITCEIYSQHESLANMGLTECYQCGKAF